MKVGIISLGSPDYSIDILADGLLRLLGRENIHLAFNKTPLSADIRYTHLMKGFFDQPNTFNIFDSDMLIVSNRSGSDVARAWIAKTGKKTVAYIDGEDDVTIREELRGLSKLYFKREFLKNRPYDLNIKPLPFAALPEEPSDRLPIERVVFFMGHYNDLPFRQRIGARLAKMGFPIANATWPKEEYNRALRSSLIGVSMRGWGFDTYRYWELPYFGCCLLSEKLPIFIPNNFVDEEEAVFYTNEDDFQARLTDLLHNPHKAERIGKNGQKACRERHLSIHRAKTLLEAMA